MRARHGLRNGNDSLFLCDITCRTRAESQLRSLFQVRTPRGYVLSVVSYGCVYTVVTTEPVYLWIRVPEMTRGTDSARSSSTLVLGFPTSLRIFNFFSSSYFSFFKRVSHCCFRLQVRNHLYSRTHATHLGKTCYNVHLFFFKKGVSYNATKYRSPNYISSVCIEY